MTPLEVILMVLCVLWLVVIKALDGSLTQAEAERDYARKLYADAIEQLEAVTADRDGWRRLVSAVRDGRK